MPRLFLYRLVVGLLLACPVALPAQDAKRNTLSAQEAAAVDAAANAELTRQQLVGLAIGVIRDGQIVYLRGYGWADQARQTPVTPQTVFNWASNSKPLVAVSAMQLVEQKKLDLDADVVRTYVPEFPDKGVVITTRQLLCHQSGIPHYTNGKIVPTEVEYTTPMPLLDPINCLNKFNRSPLIFQPGTKADYSTHAYVLLSAVVQRAGGEPLAKQIEQRIMKPLGMPSLQLDLETKDQPYWAIGYLKDRFGQIVAVPEEAHYWKHGGGGYKSDVADFARWAVGLMNHRLVSAESERLMWTRQKTTDGKETRYGLGLVPYSTEYGELVGHGGAQTEVRTQLTINPRTRFGVVVMSNCDFCKPIPISTGIAAACGQDFQALNAPNN